MAEKIYKAWHFLEDDRKLTWGDGRVVELGKTYEAMFLRGEKDPKLSDGGMHGSEDLMDAVRLNLNGDLLCRVEIWGDVDRGDTQICGRYRKITHMADASDILWDHVVRMTVAFLSIVSQSKSLPHMNFSVNKGLERALAGDHERANNYLLDAITGPRKLLAAKHTKQLIERMAEDTAITRATGARRYDEYDWVRCARNIYFRAWRTNELCKVDLRPVFSSYHITRDARKLLGISGDRDA